ncbi:MAG: PadR family transcriptional regulator [Chloroflexota bacterium]
MIATLGTYGTGRTLGATRTVQPQGPFPSGDPRHDLLRLMVLRQLEDGGPLSGNETINAVASLTCSFELASPGYPLLYELRDAGLVSATGDRPPRYAITDPGRREAERLAARCWPTIRDGLVRLNVCFGCLAPRGSEGGRSG